MATTPAPQHETARRGANAVPLVLAAFAVLLAGLLLGRATATPRPAVPSQASASGATEPAGQGIPGTGPDRVEGGVPVGYARTEAGAVAAAAQYVAAFDGERGLVEADRRAVLDVIAADDARDDLAGRMRPGMELVAEQFGIDEGVARGPGFVARSVVVGHELAGYDGEEATVRVWATSIFFAEGRQAVTGGWSTETVRLRWERDDWRLVGFTSEEGPTPPDTPTPATAGIGERINAFDRFVHVPAPE